MGRVSSRDERSKSKSIGTDFWKKNNLGGYLQICNVSGILPRSPC
jgi:hypothetical protein